MGERYASTTVVSPRGISRSSGLTAWLAETCAKPASRASSARRRSWSGYFQAWISTMAQAVMPLACARANAVRAVCSSSDSISSPSTPTRPAISTTSSYSIDGSVIARSNRRGRAWLPMRNASAKPRFTTSSVRSPLRSSKALVATVVPIFTVSTTPVGIGASSGMPSTVLMPAIAASR